MPPQVAQRPTVLLLEGGGASSARAPHFDILTAELRSKVPLTLALEGEQLVVITDDRETNRGDFHVIACVMLQGFFAVFFLGKYLSIYGLRFKIESRKATGKFLGFFDAIFRNLGRDFVCFAP